MFLAKVGSSKKRRIFTYFSYVIMFFLRGINSMKG